MLQLYIQYCGLIALSTGCIILLSTAAHSTDTSLEHSTPQIHFSTTQSTMQFCSYNLPSLCCPQLLLRYTRNTVSPWHVCIPLGECWSYMPHMYFSNIQFCPSQSSGSIWFSDSFKGTDIPVVLMSEASWVTAPLGAVALCYSIIVLVHIYQTA
jgi:hypothetical protein